MSGWEHVTPENIGELVGKRHRQKKPAPVLEKVIQKAILDYLTYRGHLVVRFNNIPVTTPDGRKIPVRQPGVSDILGCQKGSGRFYALEVKRLGGKPSEAQTSFLGAVAAAGGLSSVVYSVEDVQKLGL